MTHEILLRAIENLYYHGWCKLTYENKRGELCAAGAIVRAAGDNFSKAYPALWAVAKNVGYDCVAKWNDDPLTTFEDVINTLGEVADEMKEETATV
jgi:hypothetical protein